MEKTAEFKTTRKAARKPKNPKAITYDQVMKITAAIEAIEAKARDHIDTLVIDLTEDHGLKLPKAGNLTYTATMHGIEGAHGPIIRVALQNWANAARRALLSAEG